VSLVFIEDNAAYLRAGVGDGTGWSRLGLSGRVVVR